MEQPAFKPENTDDKEKLDKDRFTKLFNEAQVQGLDASQDLKDAPLLPSSEGKIAEEEKAEVVDLDKIRASLRNNKRS